MACIWILVWKRFHKEAGRLWELIKRGCARQLVTSCIEEALDGFEDLSFELRPLSVIKERPQGPKYLRRTIINLEMSSGA